MVKRRKVLSKAAQEPEPETKVEEPKIEEEELKEAEDVGGDEAEMEDEEGEEGDEEEEEEKELDSDPESIKSLLTCFSKEQLINLITTAAATHPKTTLPLITSLADSDPSTRKIFVHGLGWDSTAESLTEYFSQYGEIQDLKAVKDKATGKSKGYAFITYKNRKGAANALKEPQKQIGGRKVSCQLAAVGPTTPQQQQPVKQEAPVSEHTLKKIFVSNVGADVDLKKLVEFFGKFGEIEDGPLGLDKVTGKPRGFCLFVYKKVESAKKALEEPHKNFDGCILHCSKAVDGPKGNKPGAFGGGHMMTPAAGQMVPPVGQVPAAQGLNPVLGQALTALLATQGVGGLTNILASANQGLAPGMQGSYGSGGQWQGGAQGGYQGGRGRGQQGYGGGPSYMGHR